MVKNVFDRGNFGVIVLGDSYDLTMLLLPRRDGIHSHEIEGNAMNMQKGSRYFLVALLALAVVAAYRWPNAIGGENENLEQKDEQKWDASSVAELLEDGTDFFIDNLDNGGGNDASVAARDEKSYFSGKCSLLVTPFQRFKTNMPGWNYKIAENPEHGEYRYLRFAWKRTEGPGIMLQFFSGPKTWKRYYAGTVSEQTKTWGHMIRVAEEPPRKWEVVTRDLFMELGPITINGIGLSAMEEPGEAYFDHMYLGRSVEDLDRVSKRVTKAAVPVEKTPDAVEPTDSPRSWTLPFAIGAAVIVLIIAAVLAVVVFRRGAIAAKSRDKDVIPQVAMVSFPCVGCGKKLKAKAELTGKSVKCPHCEKSTVVPSR